jgi:lanthionine synthetase-like protein
VLYRPELFERLIDEPWEASRVRDAIAAIVADVDRGYRGPRQLWQGDRASRSLGMESPGTNLYAGAAGTLFALDALRRRGLAETRLDLTELAASTPELFRARPEYRPGHIRLPDRPDAALLTGETGILLVAWRLTRDDEFADALHARVLENVANEAEDVMWGTPGTLLAAATMLEWTGDERWRTAARDSAGSLLARRDEDGLWTQRLYGDELRGLGPIHGAVGNVKALGRVLEPEVRDKLEHETAALLGRMAVSEDGLANWPDAASPDPPVHLRWCAGAPGVLASSAGYLDEELLTAGAELVWRAGAARNSVGPSICCGTAGNGYALLKTFARIGDERWLDRARRFAVHALRQVERSRAAGGDGWYSLWRGDPGVALYAADCLEARAAYPLFDSG